jgi:adenylate cyclase
VTIFLIYSTLTYTGYAREEANRKKTRAAFSKYLSPDMVSRVAENPSELKLGGEERDLTLLFCDVRGFTPISELFDPQGLTALINKLLTPLTNQIMARQGTVDKYMGDCIMAFWNAPLDDENHARNGCLSALAMLAEMDPLNEKLEQEAKEEGRKHLDLKVGLGLNSGPCVVGNMGSDQRFDYSVLGDTVNLAARLEGQSKGYGVRIVLGPSTAEQVTDLAILELDNIQVKGKTEAVQIFGLVGDDEMVKTDFFQGLKPMHDKMLELYKAQKWDDCLASAKGCREYAKAAPFEIDGFYELYEMRSIDFKANPPVPPGEEWDGIFVATTK